MARIVTSGFETQRLGAATMNGEGEGGAAIGTPTINTTTKRTGAASLYSNALGSYVQWQSAVSVLDRTYYMRAYFRFEDETPATIFAFMACSINGVGQYRAMLKTNGTLGLYNGAGTQVGSDSAAISPNTWYRVEGEIRVPTAGGATGTLGLWYAPDTAGASLTQVARSTTQDVGSTVTNGHFRIGPSIGATPSGTFADDVALNDDQGSDQNGSPGEGGSVLLLPTADLAVGTGWEAPQTTGSDTTNIYDAINNVPPVGTTHSDADANNLAYIFNAANSQNNYDATLQTYTAGGVGSTDVVKVLSPLVRTGGSSATDTAGALDLLSNPDGGAETSFAAFDIGIAAADPTNWRTTRIPPIYNPTVTKGTGPTIRVGKRTTTTRVAMVDLLGLYVEFKPATVHAASASVAGGGAIAATAEVFSGETHEAEADVAGGGAIVATAVRIAKVSAPVSGTGAVAATALRIAKPTAAVAGTGALAATATRERNATAGVTGAGSVAATATRTITRTAAVAGSGAVAATATRERNASAAVAGVGTIAATATRKAYATAAVAGTGTITATAVILGAGPETHEAEADVAGGGAIAATARRIRPASAAIAGGGAIAATATRERNATIVVAGAGSIAATGSRTAQVVVALVGTGLIEVEATSGIAASADISGSGLIEAVATVGGWPGTSDEPWIVDDEGFWPGTTDDEWTPISDLEWAASSDTQWH